MKIDDKYVLRSPAFAPFNEEQAANVQAMAQPIIEALNGAIAVDAWGAGTLTEKGLTYRGASAQRNEWRALMDSVIVTDRISTTVEDADDRLVNLAALARRDPHVANAFAFYQAHTWQGYYAALDEVTLALGGGESALWNAGLAAEADIKLLKRTANSAAATGSQARHGTRFAPPATPMPMSTAREIVRQVLLGWINQKL